MDIISRALLFGSDALVTVWNMPAAAQEGASMHGMSDDAAQVYGRALAVDAYMCASFKNAKDKMTVIIEGDGKIGRIVLCGDYGCNVRGYVENPGACLKEGETLSDMVGKQGYISVIKDLGLKEPYRGYGQIITGNIADDFSGYFAVSEQTPAAIALDCRFEGGKCLVCGGVAVTALPGCAEEIIVILEDIMRNFKNVGELLLNKTPQEIIEENYGHFPIRKLPDIYPSYKCTCSASRSEAMIRALGAKEAQSLIDENGEINVHCEFCGKDYTFYQADKDRIFKEGNLS